MVTPSSQSDLNPVVDADPTDATTASPAAQTESTNNSLAESPTLAQTPVQISSLGQSWLYAGSILLAIYGLLASIDLLNIGFQSILGPHVEGLLTLAANPWLGLFLGILATALMQSSSIVTALLVALVAGGLPIITAIPMVMGASLGATITSTLVSLGYISSDDDFERGFAAATVHDCFNLLALIILFPLELLWHPLERLSQWLLSQNISGALVPDAWVSPIDWLVQPTRWMIAYSVNRLSGPWDSLLLFSSSVGGLMLSVTLLGWLLKRWLDTPAQAAIRWGIGNGSKLGGLAAGTATTALLQSAPMTTSLTVPLAGTGLVALQDIYPFVLGANLGTCITALLAALSLNSLVAQQLALVHLIYNLLAVVLIYGLPYLRAVPITMAQKLAATALRFRLAAVAYVVGLFFAVPLLALWLSFTWIAQST